MFKNENERIVPWFSGHTPTPWQRLWTSQLWQRLPSPSKQHSWMLCLLSWSENYCCFSPELFSDTKQHPYQFISFFQSVIPSKHTHWYHLRSHSLLLKLGHLQKLECSTTAIPFDKIGSTGNLISPGNEVDRPELFQNYSDLLNVFLTINRNCYLPKDNSWC